MKEKLYSIGEVFRLGLLINSKGVSYKHKATISKIINSMSYEIQNTPFGPSKAISERQIAEHNSKTNMYI